LWIWHRELNKKYVRESKKFLIQNAFMVKKPDYHLFIKKDLTNFVKDGESTTGGAMTNSPSTGSEILARGVRTRIFISP
jgi:hypothetical protein